MKKAVALLFALVIAFGICSGLCLSSSAETYVPSRTINLVYDDSGSMIRLGTTSTYVDTWCQAKYAMEVFAAMLGERDTLNIYYMSDYVESKDAAPKLSLTGSRTASVTSANVAKIHNLVTDASNTPFASVKKAYSDLKGSNSDEKWLVVLTDGRFNDAADSVVQNYFNKCVASGDIKVVMFAMGSDAATISADEKNNIFYYKADNNVDIPSKLTSVCNRIFQNNALPYDASSNTASFNVPMSELIVFAQGKSVSIGNIKSSDGTEFTPVSNVAVKYSTKATVDVKRYPERKTKVADNLSGYVATFTADFNPGTYTFDVQGAETVEVYYKPNVTIAAYLYDNDNVEVTQEEKIIAGDYLVEYGFLSGITGERVEDTSLLGDITYVSSIVNTDKSGTKNQLDVKSGDTISLKAGTLDIDVSAMFLDYNTVNTKLSYTVFEHNELNFEFTEKSDYDITTDGFTNGNSPLVLKVTRITENGIEELTAEQWELMEISEVSSSCDVGEFKVEKTDTVGVFNIYPSLKDNDAFLTSTGVVDIKVKGGFIEGDSSADGEAEDTFNINNNISGWDRFTDWLARNWWWLLIILVLIFLFLAYFPNIIKHYLPRKIKKQPVIRCRAQRIGGRDMEMRGKYEINYLSTIIPFKNETGSLLFTRNPNKTAKLKASAGSRMVIVNSNAFAGNKSISFDGMSIEKDNHNRITISKSSVITVKKADFNTTCILNQ